MSIDDKKELLERLLEQFELCHEYENPTDSDVQLIKDEIVEVLKILNKKNKELLSKRFGLKKMDSIIYYKKLTAEHVLNTILMLTKEKPEKLLLDFLRYCLIKNSNVKSDIEWFKLDDKLDETEKMFLIYMGKKVKSLLKRRNHSLTR